MCVVLVMISCGIGVSMIIQLLCNRCVMYDPSGYLCDDWRREGERKKACRTRPMHISTNTYRFSVEAVVSWPVITTLAI